MSNNKQIISKTQIKLKQYLYKYEDFLKLPEYKFLSDAIFGILKGKHIHLAKISRSLLEPISPKKTEERLSYHLGKEGLYKSIQEVYYNTIRARIKRCRYLIFDGSDIVKQEATKMSGLSLVRDGSASSKKGECVLSNGYHWDNLLGVSAHGKEILPVYSEIYSTKLDTDYTVSENRKIVNIIKDVSKITNSEQILVMDRGGDRRVLINEFIRLKQLFVIRQTGKRHLFHKGRLKPLKQISRTVKLDSEYRVVRKHNKKASVHLFHVGATLVEFPSSDLKYSIDCPLWLIIAKEQGKGYSWFLCSLNTKNKSAAIEMAMTGYQYRWKIEEFHRQVKQDYHLEDIRYQRYEAIKTIGSLLLVVMGFLSTLRDAFISLILFHARLCEKNIFNNLPDYIFYRLSEAVRISLSGTNKFIPAKNKPCLQTSLFKFP